ncbi:unnamed protein product [Blepharisma stoltei]|uniref:Rab-GAP TBC domain-containing protein n=1 Tax=Blepharisma stoltei TaxID=1481888 RepID=A0AAU9KDQ4_9CILI|nr:unnamed protein product [Blepharisma stoltei]
MSSDTKIDRHGFISSTSPHSSPETVTRDNARIQKWQDMLTRWDYNIKRRRAFLKKRIRKGIPDCLRGVVWTKLANIQTIKNEYTENYYKNLTELDSNTVSIQDITRDYYRTFSGHVLFRDHGLCQDSLYRILKAFSLHDPDLGYCQGMGVLAATFLMYMSEEDSFWMIVSLMRNYDIRDYYLPGMPGIYKAFYQINGVFRQVLPDLWDHFMEISVYPSMFAPGWMMTLYMSYFKFEISLRIFDIFLNEGKKILFKVYIALFKKSKKELISMPCDVLLEKIPNLHEDFTADSLIQSSLKFTLKKKKLQLFEKEYETNPSPELKNW